MLTKDLIRYKVKEGKLLPSFVNPKAKGLLRVAEQLIDLYNPELGLSREELKDESAVIINSYRGMKVAAGVNKILEDHCQFLDFKSSDAPRLREECFGTSFSLLRNSEVWQTFEDFEKNMTSVMEEPIEELRKGLYSDLPAKQVLEKIKPFLPASLLSRYNCSLAQSLLLRSKEIILYVYQASPEEIRQLFRYIRFFKLLAQVQDKGQGTYKIILDGPLSIVNMSSKYGLLLASFFPAVLELKKWKLEALIEIDRFDYLKLELCPEDNLKGHYHFFGGYIPEEIKVFQKYFAEKNKGWEFVKEIPVITLPGNLISVPDFVLEKEGKKVHVELFHRWHKTHLKTRLQAIVPSETKLFIFGVEKYLLKDNELKELMDRSEWFQSNGFYFTDIPSREALLRCLAKM